jgi:sugar O-acyltransferase (sialic acid O-acetyltransferase NeuD family)
MKIIIFGNKDMAQLAHYYLTKDTSYIVEAFTTEKKYIDNDSFCDLPLIAFEDIEKIYPPTTHKMFAPIYAANMNQLRRDICEKIKQKGYSFISYISSKANIWDASIGENAFILEGCNVQPFSSIGDNVIIWSFSHIGHHSVIGNNIFISGNVVIAGHNRIEDYCFMGTNCSTRDNILISEGSFVGQDASVIGDLDPSWRVWVGVPAKNIKSSINVI